MPPETSCEYSLGRSPIRRVFDPAHYTVLQMQNDAYHAVCYTKLYIVTITALLRPLLNRGHVGLSPRRGHAAYKCIINNNRTIFANPTEKYPILHGIEI